jgi:hypothetical protein
MEVNSQPTVTATVETNETFRCGEDPELRRGHWSGDATGERSRAIPAEKRRWQGR